MTAFSDEELRGLAFETGIDWDTLPGATKLGKARELIIAASQRGKTIELMKLVIRQRDNL